MFKLWKSIQGYFRAHRQMLVIGALALSSCLGIALYMVRVIGARNLAHTFLLWNLFLAWLPMWFALAAYNTHAATSRARWVLVIGWASMWLLFMPNTLYLVTDFVNLYYMPSMLFWYDLIIFALFIWTGVFLGLVSLFLMQEIVRKSMGRLVSWVFALGVMVLNSFGIYLGRFLRWNSWDIFSNPIPLLRDIAETMSHPIANREPYIFSVVFSVFILSAYLMLKAMVDFKQEAVEVSPTAQ